MDIVERIRKYDCSDGGHSDAVGGTIYELAEEAASETEMLRAALRVLADAADVVGVKYFDTDTMDPEVEDLQAATSGARALLNPT